MSIWSVMFVVPLLALPWFFTAEASHFRGGVIMSEPDPAYSSTVRFTFRLAFRRSYSPSYFCDQSMKDSGAILGSGGSWKAKCDTPQCYLHTIADTGFHCTDFSVLEDWSMGENNFTYTFPADSNIWTVSYSSCCWIAVAQSGVSSWILSTTINITRRSDTGKINSSPVTTTPAIVRVRKGCLQSIRIPTEDPDGDLIRCRWSDRYESAIERNSFSYVVLDEANCTLIYQGGGVAGEYYAAALTLEDYPAGTTDFNGIHPYSSVGLQFLVIITNQSGSCDSKPVFTGSTPQDNQCSEIQIGFAFTALIEVTHVDLLTQISELITSSPSGLHISSLSLQTRIYSANVTWYPGQYQTGKHVFCFKAVDSLGIESETRCITILVGLTYTPNVILDSFMPIVPISRFGPGFMVWSAAFDRVIKKPKTPSFIRLVLRSNGHLVYKVDTLSSYVIVGENQTVLYFAMPFAVLSMTESYAILIDQGAVVGQGCSYDGPPTPGLTSTNQWAFNITGVCDTGYSLRAPAFNNCIDVNECGTAHPRSKRSLFWPVSSSSITSSTSLQPLPAMQSLPGSCSYFMIAWRGNFSSPNHPSSYDNNHDCTWLISVPQGYYVELEFLYFHLEHGYSYCPYDYVEIFDGNSPSAPRIIKRCGYHSPWCVHSSGHSLMVRLITDYSVTHSGFSARYEAVSYRSSNCHSTNSTSIATSAAPTAITPTTTSSFVSSTVPSSARTPMTSSSVLSSVPSSEAVVSPTMSSSFHFASIINVQPDPGDFELHLPSDCSHICTNTPGSFICSCYEGFQLDSDGRTCIDIDECATNNGRCSHRCNNVPGSYYCTCEEGTTAVASDNKTCLERGVSVTCADDNITVSFEKQSFPFFDSNLLHLRHPSCKAQVNSTHIILATSLNDCGTLQNETEDALIFWNEVVASAVNIRGLGITRTHNIRIPFFCRYGRKKLVTLNFTPRFKVFGEEVGYGNFTFEMKLYKTSSYTEPYSQQEYPVSVGLNENLYVMYSVQSSSVDLVVMAENCRATRDGSVYSWPQYTIIDNGCPRDATMEYNYDDTSDRQRFILKAFRFFDDYRTVYIHCEVVACFRTSPNSRLVIAICCCSGGNRRKRRGLEAANDESTKKLLVSRGPLLIKDGQEPSDAEDGGDSRSQSSNQRALIGGVIAIGGFSVVVLVAFTLLFVKYRIARLFINRNKVGDMYSTQEENMRRRNEFVQEERIGANDHVM